MSTNKQRDAEAMLIRRIVPALDHDQCHMIARALQMYDVTLTGLDREFPDPERRDIATRARALSRIFFDANKTRDFLETGT